jgi:hypothetical protein
LALSSIPILSLSWLFIGCFLLSQSICFPIVVLSQMSSEHAFDFFNPDVAAALVRYKSGWGRYGLVTAGAWIVCGASLSVVTTPYTWGPLSLLWVVTWMVTGRALGLLALESSMPIGPHRRNCGVRPVA